jgi:fused signal recognition particle receptor
MGLIDFLKKKFSHKKEEPETAVPEAKADNKSDNSNIEEQVGTSEIKPEESNIKEADHSETNSPAAVSGTEEDDKETYVRGLKKAHHGFMYRLKALTHVFHKVNEEYFNDLEEILIEADVGADLTFKIIDEAKKVAKAEAIDDPEGINKLVIEKMFEGYEDAGKDIKPDLNFVSEGPTVLLVVGVNGGGKTTTIAKLANRYKKAGKKILLVAADTFRAGAVEQLGVWAQRIGVDILIGPEGADPSSVCYDGLSKAVKEKYDLVIVDTAGRLQNKANLMAELSKMKRVMAKVIPTAPHESFLVIDANTGQNGIEQAQVFKEAVSLTGIVITKMDGTSKGGIILAIRDKLGIPVRFIGLGEGMDDLKEFNLDEYLYGLLVGEDE